MKTYKEQVNEANRNNPNAHRISGEELVKLKKTLLEMYLDVQEVCVKNHLTCVLVGGSALGAIRHKGFIPWDDDLDMGMPRKDFEVLKKIFKEQLGEKYILNSPNYEGRATNRFPKILKKGTKFVEFGMPDDDRACIKIDVFILENVPDNQIVRYLKAACCTLLMFIASHVLSYENWIRKPKEKRKKITKRLFTGRLFSFRSSDSWFNSVDNACCYKKDTSRFVNIPTGRKHYFGEMLEREVYFPVSEGVFEGKLVFLPHVPDTYLKNLYGDYMTIPPEDKRETHYVEYIRF